MRMVSYNILDGGEGRADPLTEVLLAQKADIVALQEADNLGVLDRIAWRLNMDCIRAQSSGVHAAALLTRWTIVHSINHGLLRAGSPCCLESLVREPGGREWAIGVVHLHARAFEADERVREKEIGVLLDIFAAHRAAGRAHLVAGDFNANSPIQRIDPARCKPTTRRAWDENGGGIPRRAIQMMLDAGYVDSLHAVAGDAAGAAGSFTTQFPGQRVDCIFAFGLAGGRLRDAWIETDRLAKYASDHFPVGVDIGREHPTIDAAAER